MPRNKSQNAPGGMSEKKRKRGEKIPPGVRHEALRLIRDGWTNTQVSAHLGISEGSARKLRKEADASPPTPAPVEPETPNAAASLPPELEDLTPEAGLALVRRQIAELQKLAEEARADRNFSAAARFSGNVATLIPVMARLQAAVAANTGDAVSIPRDKIESEIEAIYGRSRTLASVELCPQCGRELRMAAVGAAREKEQKL